MNAFHIKISSVQLSLVSTWISLSILATSVSSAKSKWTIFSDPRFSTNLVRARSDATDALDEMSV